MLLQCGKLIKRSIAAVSPVFKEKPVSEEHLFVRKQGISLQKEAGQTGILHSRFTQL